MFAVRDLTLRIGGKTLFSGLNVKLDGGVRLGVTGSSGVGKTTLLRSIVSGGWPAGSTWSEWSPVDARMFYSAQLPNLPDFITVRDLLDALAPDVATWRAALHAVSLEEAVSRRIQFLSGGEKQRLAVAAAACVDAGLYLFDEPATGLDGDLKANCLKFLSAVFSQRKASVLMVSHDPFVLGLLCDRVISLPEGRELTFSAAYPRTIGDLTEGTDQDAFKNLCAAMYQPLAETAAPAP